MSQPVSGSDPEQPGQVPTVAEEVGALPEASTFDYRLLHRISTILLSDDPEEQLFAKILEVVLTAFASPIGFFGYIDENGDLVCPSLTQSAWQRCRMPDKDILFAKECWRGIWGEALNRRQALLANGGLRPPEGHLPLCRAMAAPLVVGDILVGELAVANSGKAYSHDDLRRLDRLAQHIAPALLAHLRRKAETKNREQAEAALRHGQLVLQTLIDGVTESVFLMDRQGTALACNTTLAARLGQVRDDLLGQNLYDFLPPEVEARRRQYVEQVIARRAPVFFEDERSGNTILNSIYPIVDDRGEVRQFAIVGYDLTERKRIETELRNAKTRLEQAQRIARMGGWEYHPASQRLTWSREIYEIYGVDESYDPSDIERDIGYYAVEHQPIIAKAFTLAVEQGVPYDLELRFTRHDGTPLWVRTMGEPVVEDGKVVRVYGNIIDVSERKRMALAQAELEEKNRQIQKAESLNCMAGAIAHHYNNLLGAIIGNIELAREFLEKGSQAAPYLRHSLEAASKAANLSRQMLTYLGVSHERLLPLDLGELCRKEVEELRRSLPKEVVLESSLPPHGPLLTGDASHLALALRQLVTSAKEAMEEGGGTITLNVATRAATALPEKNRFPLEWRASQGEYAELVVADNACGIDEHDIDKLFDPFFTSKFTGRGLGLPMVLGVVKAHNGAVAVASEKGRGSVFRLFLPLLATQQKPKM